MNTNTTITAPRGFQAGTAACGIKESGDLDVGLVVADTSCAAAGVFTTNRFCGAPIVVGREHLQNGKLRAIVVNSGCSNVATGRRGIADARKTCRIVADILGIHETQVLPASTGMIGKFLPMDKIEDGIREAVASLSDAPQAGQDFARAIMTTDLKIKQACERVKINRTTVTVAGCCKGSGMIAPNMATMLAYITTDAGLNQRRLRALLLAAADKTFNRVTVDECESTSDMVVAMASGMATDTSGGRAESYFAGALQAVCESLSYQIVRDGEGATRVLEVIVKGARSVREAHQAARAIAVSPLVKTAVHGGDPNWGRIIQALGQTEVAYKPDSVVVMLGKTVLFRKGAPAPGLSESKLEKLMDRKHVAITVDLNAGAASDRVLTCDLSRDYVKINADYRT
ncbi:MAG TPA: bifunctional glutamate N-acetyltransferase/amino-acid acetyltransferase ArgJ [Phycisphaerae bacterium]|nr:bifunctional glutamate N-acetyltransferase/amino-acid acetyltransferase ArgJ [Phycisphaerae bacterium]